MSASGFESVFHWLLVLKTTLLFFLSVYSARLSALSHFPANVPQIPFLDTCFFFFWWILQSSYIAAPLLVMGAGRQGIRRVVLVIGTYFHGCMPVGFFLAIYTVGCDSRIALGRYSGRCRSDI
jgi:hypothetical protein